MTFFLLYNETKQAFEEFKEQFYGYAEAPGKPEIIFFQSEPNLRIDQYEKLVQGLHEMNEILDAKYIEGVLENLEEGSAFYDYITFDEEEFQSDYIQEHSNGDEEELGAVQQNSVDYAFTRKQDLWGQVEEDIKFLIEEQLPQLFD